MIFNTFITKMLKNNFSKSFNATLPYSHKGFQDLSNKKRKAFTLPEALIAIAIIGIIAALFMGNLNNGKVKQRELLGKFDIIFSKLNDLTQMTAAMSKNYSNWSADVGSLKNLTCTDSNGREVDNKSQCLKTALMSQSNQITDISDPADAFKNYDALKTQLKSIFPSLQDNDLVAFKLHGSAYVLAAYLDGSCEMEVPISQVNGVSETKNGCGFLLADVNGKEKPNKLITNEDEIIDRFLMVLTKDGVEKSSQLAARAGCPKGKTWDEETGSCVVSFDCPYNMDRMNEIKDANNENLLNITYYDDTHRNCFIAKCKYGTPDEDNNCPPQNCENPGEQRMGGLWTSEGGDIYPNTYAQKACCIPVSNQSELNNIRNNLSGNYCLTTDINFSKTGAGSTEANGWTPIGTSDTPFTGTFYGNGHKIKNFYINDTNETSSSTDVGLFGVVQNANIENLEITGKITKSISTGNGSNNHVGAVVGRSRSGSLNIYNVVNAADIIINPTNGYTISDSEFNGIIGSDSSVTKITNAINNGNFIFLNESGSTSKVKDSCISGLRAHSNCTVDTYYSYSELTNVVNSGSFNFPQTKSQNLTLTDIRFNGIANNSGSLNNAVLGGIKNAINSGSLNINGSNIKIPQSSYTDYSGIARSAVKITNAINYGNMNITGENSTFENSMNGIMTLCISLGSTRIYNAINLGGAYALNNQYNEANSGIIQLTDEDTYAYIRNVINLGGTETTKSIGIAGSIKNKNSEITNALNMSTIQNNYFISHPVKNMTIKNAFYLTGSIKNKTYSSTDYPCANCKAVSEADAKTNATTTFAKILSDTTKIDQIEAKDYWSIINGYYPTLKASVMPPQTFRDCRNNANPYGGCYDVLNTPNAFMPDFQQNNINTIIATEENKPYIMWAWKIPNPKVEAPVLRWQCKPYRVDGYDCCKPSYATWEKKLQSCPAINPANYPNYRTIN